MFDDFEFIDAKAVGFANELDGFKSTISDVDSPSESGAGHGELLKAGGVGKSSGVMMRFPGVRNDGVTSALR